MSNKTHKYEQHFNELPTLRIHRQRLNENFILENFDLEVRGFSINECIAGMEYLFEKAEKKNADSKLQKGL